MQQAQRSRGDAGINGKDGETGATGDDGFDGETGDTGYVVIIYNTVVILSHQTNISFSSNAQCNWYSW